MSIRENILNIFSKTFKPETTRGKSGQFISEEKAEKLTTEDVPNLVHKSAQMSGALKEVEENLEEKKLEEPLVEVKVNNPLSWFKKWLASVKKKQTTTVTFKLGIPLIALPIIIIALLTFILGMSKYQEKKSMESKPIEGGVFSPIPQSSSKIIFSRVGSIKAVRNKEKFDYFIVLSQGEAIKLQFTDSFNPSNYVDKKVLVSGEFDKEINILKVESVSDLSKVSPTPSPTIIPEVTLSPTPLIESTPTIVPAI